MASKRRRSNLKFVVPVTVITIVLVSLLFYANFAGSGSYHAKVQIYIWIQTPDNSSFRVIIPAGIGAVSDKWVNHTLDQYGLGTSPVHTEDGTGLVFVDSKSTLRYTLGDFFNVWGQRFNNTCVMQYCNGFYYHDSTYYVVSVIAEGQRLSPNRVQFSTLPLFDGFFYRIEFLKAASAP